MIRKIGIHIRKNITDYLLFMLFFILGAAAGAACVYFLPEEKKATFCAYLQNYIASFAGGTKAVDSVLRTELTNQFKANCAFLCMGFFDMGIVFVIVFLFLKGAALGFSGGCIVGLYSYKGFLYCAGIFLADLLFIIPSLLFAGVCIKSFRLKISSSGRKAYKSFTAAYVVMMGFAFIINTLGTLTKALYVPYILMHLAPGL